MLPILPTNATLQQVIDAVNRLSEHIQQTEILPNTDGWANAQTNVTEDRSFDANATSTAELADVLGTLIGDLINNRTLR